MIFTLISLELDRMAFDEKYGYLRRDIYSRSSLSGGAGPGQAVFARESCSVHAKLCFARTIPDPSPLPCGCWGPVPVVLP